MIWTFLTAVVVLTILSLSSTLETKSSRTIESCPLHEPPPGGLVTAATENGFITIYSKELSARMAGPMFSCGVFRWRYWRLFMAIISLHDLFPSVTWLRASRLRRRDLVVVISIGPAGQLATAFRMMGQFAAGYNRFAEYTPTALQPSTCGTFWTAQTAQGLQGSGIFFALLILGFGHLMLCLAIVGVVDVFVEKQVKYSLTWWSLVVPSGTIATTWMELASSMDSPAFRGLVCAMTVLLYVVYFINWGFTIWGIVDGSLIFGNTHLETKMELMAKSQEQAKKEEDV